MLATMWEKKCLKTVLHPSKEVIPGTALLKSRYIPKFVRVYESLEISTSLPNGAILILAWSCVIHLFGCYPLMLFLKLHFKRAPNINIYLGICRAVIYLFYPIFNYIGESWISRYKVMITGTVLSLIGILFSGPSMAMIFKSCFGQFLSDSSCNMKYSVISIAFTGLLLYYIGVGLFEANSLPFAVNLLQANTREKIPSYLNLYVWVTHVSQYGGLPLFYSMVHVSSTYCCIGISLIPLFLLLVCCHEYRKHLSTESSTRIHTPLHLLPNCISTFLCKRQLYSSKGHHSNDYSSSDDGFIFNKIFIIMLTLIGFFLMQLTCLPRNVSFDFDDDWLIGNRLMFLTLTEIFQSIPIFSIIILMVIRSNASWFTMSPVSKLWRGILLSVGVLILSLLCSLELESAYNFIRSVHPLISFLILILSLFKGIANLFISLGILELVFLYAPQHCQGLLLSLWNCFWFFPVSLISFNSITRREIFFTPSSLLLSSCIAIIAIIPLKFVTPGLSLHKKTSSKISLHV